MKELYMCTWSNISANLGLLPHDSYLTILFSNNAGLHAN